MDRIITTNSVEETQMIGEHLTRILKVGDIVVLTGDLGSGKTELVRGFMREISPNSIVRSPSFSLVNSYELPNFRVNHFDFYRLGSIDELFEIGFDEYINDNSITFIEWGEMFLDAIPANHFYMKFNNSYDNHREIVTNITNL